MDVSGNGAMCCIMVNLSFIFYLFSLSWVVLILNCCIY